MSGFVVGLHANPEGGVPKHPVPSLTVEVNGCVGDRQRNLRYHGGPSRAVCLMTTSVLSSLQAEGHPIGPGTTGENVLVDLPDSASLDVGVCLELGSVVLRITGDAPPCKTIRSSFEHGTFLALSHHKNAGMTRWYAEVLAAGTIRVGDSVRVINEGEQVGSP